MVLNTVFVTMAFCSGMPLLLPFAFFSVFVTYWVDKVAMLRFYAKPPTMGDDLHKVLLLVVVISSLKTLPHSPRLLVLVSAVMCCVYLVHCHATSLR